MSNNSETPHLNGMGQIIQGGIASLFVNGVTHPLGTIKNRLMVRTVRSVQSIVSFRGLYNGYWAITISDAATFSVAYLTNDYFADRNVSVKSTVMAGLVSSPITAVGEGLMANRQVNALSYSQIVKRAFRPSGLICTALREVPFIVAVFYATPILERSVTRKFEVQERPSLINWGIQIASGAVVGAIAGVLTAPVDLVKTRVQTSESRQSIRSVVRTVLQEGGWKAMFQGGTARAFYIGLAVASMNLVNHAVPNVLPDVFRSED